MNLYNVSEDMLLKSIEDYKKKLAELKVCFLLTHVPNPRMNKRINVYKRNGHVSVICTRRKSQNIWEPQIDGVDYNIFDVDLPSSAHIIKRAIVSSGYQTSALKKLNEIRPNVLYCGGLDSLIIAAKYMRKNINTKVIYEVADLRESYIAEPKNIIKRFLNNYIKVKEKKLFKNVELLVVTSPLFYDRYYCNLISRDRMVFIPNAPDKEIFANYKHKSKGRFTIGFIGGIRYLKQMKMLVDVAGELECDVLFAGAGGTSSEYEEITTYCRDKEYVTFTGRYDYEKEIVGLYEKVDCVYAVYDADNPNVRIALPNKLYEAIVCELPILVARGTYLSELVQEWNVGVAVKHDDSVELKKELTKLMDRDSYYNKIVEGCREIKSNFMTESLDQKISL